ncbi:hypothetical protein MTKAM_07530 [Moorella thermoacetica]
MRAEFSEFQYAYGCTRELEDGTSFINPLGIPFFPTQVEEATRGYDVLFRGAVAPVFIQYKLAEYISNRRGKEWPYFRRPYFRFGIYPNSRSGQHNLLVDLSAEEPFVFYCAPTFIYRYSYLRAYIDRKITLKSVFVPCKGLPYINDTERHYIVYSLNSTKGYWCSEPQIINLIHGWENLAALYHKNENTFDKISRVILRLEQFFKINPEKDISIHKANENNAIILRIKYIAAFSFVRYSLVLGLLVKR